MWGFQQKIPKKPVARPLVSVSAGPQKLSLASVVVCFFLQTMHADAWIPSNLLKLCFQYQFDPISVQNWPKSAQNSPKTTKW